MLTREQVHELAAHWVQAWSSHDPKACEFNQVRSMIGGEEGNAHLRGTERPIPCLNMKM